MEVEVKGSRSRITIYEKSIEQGRIHGSISHARWAGALMEVRSPFGWNSADEKNGRPTTDGRMDRRTDRKGRERRGDKEDEQERSGKR